jgi:hypothetical protein
MNLLKIILLNLVDLVFKLFFLFMLMWGTALFLRAVTSDFNVNLELKESTTGNTIFEYKTPIEKLDTLSAFKEKDLKGT